MTASCKRVSFQVTKGNTNTNGSGTEETPGERLFAGQKVGVTQVGERIWLVTFMQDDLGYFDDETCRLEPIENPFGPKVLPLSPEWTAGNWLLRLDSNQQPSG